MSRIGVQPIVLPAGVTCQVSGRDVQIKGPRGMLSYQHRPEVTVALDAGTLRVTRADDSRPVRAYHGLTRALLANMVVGVTQGYEKRLIIEGVGYKGELLSPRRLQLTLGFSHPVVVEAPEGVTLELRSPTEIHVRGCDKQQVGQAAATIRAWHQPEPYNGKGIRYHDEVVRRKEGKSVVGAGA